MTYIKLQPSDSVVDSEKIVTPSWSNNSSVLTNFYTPNISDNGFYIDVYKESLSINPLADVQFSLSYANLAGSGNLSGLSFQTSDNTKFTKINYGTFRQKILNSETEYFNFGSDVASNDIYVISLSRSSYKESIKGGFNLKLKSGSNILSLTDDSNTDIVNNYIGSTRYYNIISGSNGLLASGSSIINTTAGTYGMVLPDLGLIVLNPSALALPFVSKGIGLTTLSNPSNISQRNEMGLLGLIQAGQYFEAYAEETVTSKYYYCRASNSDCNYTNNPSFIDGNGNIFTQSLIDSPTTFISTVGLYNDKHELVAVAKVSKPIKKQFTLETLLRVKLSW